MRTSKGFTLLELLVVIAIIGILSTIVLASVSYARDRGRNSYINNSMYEYVNAFSMYFSSNGSYPTPSSDLPTPTKCLGHRSTECGLVTYNAGTVDSSSPFGEQNSQLDSEIETVYSAAPGFENVLQSSSGSSEVFFQGPTYVCDVYADARCKAVTLTWYLIGNDQKCTRNGTAANDGAATVCTISLN